MGRAYDSNESEAPRLMNAAHTLSLWTKRDSCYYAEPVRKTFAPIGKTPVARVSDPHGPNLDDMPLTF